MEKETILLIAIAALAVLNAVSFGLMAYDKQCARLKKWRVPEKTLFLATPCFGGLGGLLGMTVMRHKTKHWYFRLFFPLLLVLQLALLVWGYLALFR